MAAITVCSYLTELSLDFDCYRATTRDVEHVMTHVGSDVGGLQVLRLRRCRGFNDNCLLLIAERHKRLHTLELIKCRITMSQLTRSIIMRSLPSLASLYFFSRVDRDENGDVMNLIVAAMRWCRDLTQLEVRSKGATLSSRDLGLITKLVRRRAHTLKRLVIPRVRCKMITMPTTDDIVRRDGRHLSARTVRSWLRTQRRRVARVQRYQRLRVIMLKHAMRRLVNVTFQ